MQAIAVKSLGDFVYEHGHNAMYDGPVGNRPTRKQRMRTGALGVRSLHNALSSTLTNSLLPLRLMHVVAINY
jgi:hypothetical protein